MIESNIGLIGQDNATVPLKRAAIHARVLATTLEVEVIQDYANDSERNIEVVYTFPLPMGAVLLELDLTFAGKRYRGTVVERSEAEERYEQAIEQGHSAFRLQQITKHLFTASLGNLLAGERARVRYRYAMILAWNKDVLTVRIPTTVAPRYGQTTALEPWALPQTSFFAEYGLELDLTIGGPLAHAAIECPTHRTHVEPLQGQTRIRLAKGATLDRDVVVNIRSECAKTVAIVAPIESASLALCSFSPRLASPTDATPRTIIIVVDCSGSMSGDSVAQAREALGVILERLRTHDFFELLAFGDGVKAFSGRALPASRRNKQLAQRFVDALDADLGGTEIERALSAALSVASPVSACDLLLITDGEAWIDDRLGRRARELGRRIFTVGVGSAVAEEVVQGLAAASGGACEMVSPNEAMVERITRHFERLLQPRIDAVHICWPAKPDWQVSLRNQPLFAGDTQTVCAAFQGSIEGEVTLELVTEDSVRLRERITLDASAASTMSADTLMRLAAHARMQAAAPGEALRLALEHQLVSPRTDYLIVVERGAEARADALPKLAIVPSMLPAGWGGTGSVAAAPAVLRLSDRSAFVESPRDPYYARGGRPESSDQHPLFSRKAQPVSLTPHEFTRALAARIRIWPFASERRLPRTIDELIAMGLPCDVTATLRALHESGRQEAELVRAFLVALVRSAAGFGVASRLQSLLAKRAASGVLVDLFSQALTDVEPDDWHWKAPVSMPDDRFEIPAFLRAQAD